MKFSWEWRYSILSTVASGKRRNGSSVEISVARIRTYVREVRVSVARRGVSGSSVEISAAGIGT